MDVTSRLNLSIEGSKTLAMKQQTISQKRTKLYMAGQSKAPPRRPHSMSSLVENPKTTLKIMIIVAI
jgi:hypothetical protein